MQVRHLGEAFPATRRLGLAVGGRWKHALVECGSLPGWLSLSVGRGSVYELQGDNEEIVQGGSGEDGRVLACRLVVGRSRVAAEEEEIRPASCQPGSSTSTSSPSRTATADERRETRDEGCRVTVTGFAPLPSMQRLTHAGDRFGSSCVRRTASRLLGQAALVN